MEMEVVGPSSDEAGHSTSPPCTHGRMVDDERKADGSRSGRLICMECGAVVPDPFPGPSSTE